MSGAQRGPRWHWPVSFKDDQAVQMEAMFITLWELVGGSKQDLVNRCFIKGMEMISSELEVPDSDASKAAAVHTAAVKLRHQQQVDRELGLLFEAHDEEAFEAFCDKNGIDIESVREKYESQYQGGANQWQDQAEAFLEEVLRSGPRSVKEVRKLAAERNVVRNEQQFGYLRVLAHRLGYSSKGRRGIWQLK